MLVEGVITLVVLFGRATTTGVAIMLCDSGASTGFTQTPFGFDAVALFGVIFCGDSLTDAFEGFSVDNAFVGLGGDATVLTFRAADLLAGSVA